MVDVRSGGSGAFRLVMRLCTHALGVGRSPHGGRASGFCLGLARSLSLAAQAVRTVPMCLILVRSIAWACVPVDVGVAADFPTATRLMVSAVNWAPIPFGRIVFYGAPLSRRCTALAGEGEHARLCLDPLHRPSCRVVEGQIRGQAFGSRRPAETFGKDLVSRPRFSSSPVRLLVQHAAKSYTSGGRLSLM